MLYTIHTTYHIILLYITLFTSITTAISPKPTSTTTSSVSMTTTSSPSGTSITTSTVIPTCVGGSSGI